ncbi:hypothetical protein LPJ66_006736 [Kickxella alabastrina]|uniref:Uncharacterized protein n=1 Tax=Kickxella alabastrina TaxID=61397 RepID=A0ACC1IBK0_9FUNG|nr:hypothetical protein LPJ66_006736 [Kickxella alabastrina]
MAEKRKSKDKDASAKKSKAPKSSKKLNGGTSKDLSVQPASMHSSIPYPAAINSSSFIESTTKLTVTLAAIHSRDFWAGVYETLNGVLLHFVPQVRGVVLSYSKVKLLSDSALLFNDSPYAQLEISAKLLLWRPVSGMSLEGTINVQSPDHIGMLLWDTFNASIPASFIPKDKYEWRPFSDEEIAARAAPVSNNNNASDNEQDEDEAEASTMQIDAYGVPSGFGENKFGSGEWVHKGTSQSIGADGGLEFVVVDVIRANEVLSVTGALR